MNVLDIWIEIWTQREVNFDRSSLSLPILTSLDRQENNKKKKERERQNV